MLRESRTRYGRRSGGYVWALISPMILLVSMIVMFSFISRPAGAGDSLVVFFITAILPIFLVKNMIARGANAIRANRVLMHYPQVNAFEVVTARAILECLSYFIVLILFALIMFAYFGLPFTAWMDRPVGMIGAGGALFVLCYGSGFLSSQIGRAFELWNELTGPLGRIILLTSGLFFTLGSLPPEFLAVVKYNPVAHIVEWIRDVSIRDFTVICTILGIRFKSALFSLRLAFLLTGYTGSAATIFSLKKRRAGTRTQKSRGPTRYPIRLPSFFAPKVRGALIAFTRRTP